MGKQKIQPPLRASNAQTDAVRTIWRGISAVALVLSSAACASGDETTPAKETPVLQGTVDSAGGAPPADARVALLLTASPQNPDAMVAWIAPPTDLTNGFQIALSEPPPAEALLRWTIVPDQKLVSATGRIALVRAGADPMNVLPADVLGVDLLHEVVYFGGDRLTEVDRPTRQEIAKHRGVSAEDGYHLATLAPFSLPERAAERAAYRACRWPKGLCVQTRDPLQASTSRVSALTRDLRTWEHGECMKQTPTPDTCTLFIPPDPYTPRSDEEVNETEDCKQKIRALYPNDYWLGGMPSANCLPPPRRAAASKQVGFEDTVNIRVGATLFDHEVQFL